MSIEIFRNKSIPHTFHQVWFDIGNGRTPPARYASFQESWRNKHPDAKFILWNERKSLELLETYHPEFVPIFLSYKNRMYQIDAIRLFILLHHGGIYIDMDMYADKCIYPLLDENKGKVVLCRCRMIKQMINNFFMAAPPNHPFFHFAIQQLRIRSNSMFHLEKSVVGTLYVAGPWMLHSCTSLYHEPSDLCILPYQTFSSQHTGQRENYGFHEYSNSWSVPTKAVHDEVRFLLLPFIVGLVLFMALKHMYVTCSNNWKFI